MAVIPRSFLPFWVEDNGAGTAPVQRQGFALAFFLLLCSAAAIYAAIYAPSSSGTWGWYPRLVKPAWAPTPATTGPVSTAFYLVLAVSIWRIWRTGAFRNVPFTMLGFTCLLALQTLWSTFFYGMHSPLLGLADLTAVALLAAVLWLTYRQIDSLAGWLWLAYLAWVLLLLPVNAAIWWLNA